MTSLWARGRLRPPLSPLFTQTSNQAYIKENIKAPRHKLLSGEFTGDRWIPRTAEIAPIWWCPHDACKGHRMLRKFLGICFIETWLVGIGHGMGMAPSRWPAIAQTKASLYWNSPGRYGQIFSTDNYHSWIQCVGLTNLHWPHTESIDSD